MNESWFHYDRENQLITVRQGDKPDLKVTPKDVETSFFSGGPGGQNVNKNMNGVRLIYEIPDGYLMVSQKTRQLVTRSMSERSREQNMKTAFDQLADKIKRYFYVLPNRKKTRIPRVSKENRLQNKKLRGKLKQDRKRIEY